MGKLLGLGRWCSGGYLIHSQVVPRRVPSSSHPIHSLGGLDWWGGEPLLVEVYRTTPLHQPKPPRANLILSNIQSFSNLSKEKNTLTLEKTKLGPPARCPFSPTFFWLGGFRYYSRRPAKSWYPYSNLLNLEDLEKTASQALPSPPENFLQRRQRQATPWTSSTWCRSWRAAPGATPSPRSASARRRWGGGVLEGCRAEGFLAFLVCSPYEPRGQHLPSTHQFILRGGGGELGLVGNQTTFGGGHPTIDKLGLIYLYIYIWGQHKLTLLVEQYLGFWDMGHISCLGGGCYSAFPPLTRLDI